MDQVDSSQPSAVSSVLPAGSSNLLSHDVKDLQRVSKYAAKKESHLQKLSQDVSEMGKLKSIWDSKVPEKNKRWYNCVAFSASNPEEILEEIKIYQDFYGEMASVVRQVNENAKEKQKSGGDDEKDVSEKEDEETDTGGAANSVKQRIQMFEKGIRKEAEKDSDIGNGSCEEKADNEDTNPYLLILELNEKLTEMTKAAKLGEKSTGSSTVYKLHKEFIARHNKLESMIKKIECVALKGGLRTATEGWKEAIHAVGDLKNVLQEKEDRYDRLGQRCDRLATQNEFLLNQLEIVQENMQKINAKLEQQKKSDGGR